MYLDGSDSKSGKLARTRQVAGQKQEHRKDLLQDRSARIRATLQVAPFCEVNIVYSPLLARRRCRRAPTGTAGAPTGGGSVAGPGPVAAPSPGSYPGHHPLTCPYGSDARRQSYHPLACPYGSDARGQSCHPLACPYGTDPRGQRHPSNSAHPRQKTGGSVVSQPSLEPMAAPQRLQQSCLTGIILQT